MPPDESADLSLSDVHSLIAATREVINAWDGVLSALTRLRASRRAPAPRHVLDAYVSAAQFVRELWITAQRELGAAKAQLESEVFLTAEYAHLLPPRVGTEGQQRTVGYASIAGRFIGELISGYRDPLGGRDRYAIEAGHRLQECGLDTWNRHHLEAKLVARMREVRATVGRVEINNVPCGVEQTQVIGCHHILPDMLPEEATLTVVGVYTDGRAFAHVYQGRGPAW